MSAASSSGRCWPASVTWRTAQPTPSNARRGIARALVTNPPLLLCDEPTGNLDPDTSWEILELLNDVNIKGTTVVVATHSHDLVDRMRRRTLVLRNGELVRDDADGGYSL